MIAIEWRWIFDGPVMNFYCHIDFPRQVRLAQQSVRGPVRSWLIFIAGTADSDFAHQTPSLLHKFWIIYTRLESDCECPFGSRSWFHPSHMLCWKVQWWEFNWLHSGFIFRVWKCHFILIQNFSWAWDMQFKSQDLWFDIKFWISIMTS